MDTAIILKRLEEKRKAGKKIVAVTASTGLNVRLAEEAGIDFAVVHKESMLGIDGSLPLLARIGYGGNCNEIMMEEADNLLRFSKNMPVVVGIGVAEPYHNVDWMTEKILKKGYSGITHLPTSGGWVGDFGNSIEKAGCGYSEEIRYIKRWSEKGAFTVGFCFEKEQIDPLLDANPSIIVVYIHKTENETQGWEDAKSEEQAIKNAKEMAEIIKEKMPEKIVMATGGDISKFQKAYEIMDEIKVDGYLYDEIYEDTIMYQSVFGAAQEMKKALEETL